MPSGLEFVTGAELPAKLRKRAPGKVLEGGACDTTWTCVASAVSQRTDAERFAAQPFDQILRLQPG